MKRSNFAIGLIKSGHAALLGDTHQDKKAGQVQPFCFGAQQSKRAGQALLMTVVMIGAAMLSATIIAGIFMIYQIRGSTDVANSQRAIAAADAGLECQMYDEFQNHDASHPYLDCVSIVLSNSAAVTKILCTDTSDNSVVCTATSSVSNIYSSGSYKGAGRTLQVSF